MMRRTLAQAKIDEEFNVEEIGHCNETQKQIWKDEGYSVIDIIIKREMIPDTGVNNLNADKKEIAEAIEEAFSNEGVAFPVVWAESELLPLLNEQVDFEAIECSLIKKPKALLVLQSLLSFAIDSSEEDLKSEMVFNVLKASWIPFLLEATGTPFSMDWIYVVYGTKYVAGPDLLAVSAGVAGEHKKNDILQCISDLIKAILLPYNMSSTNKKKKHFLSYLLDQSKIIYLLFSKNNGRLEVDIQKFCYKTEFLKAVSFLFNFLTKRDIQDAECNQ